MSIKKDIPFALVGLTLEGVGMWLLHRLGYINLQQVDWHNKSVWIFFLVGFLTAYWLVLWLRLIHKISSHKNKKTQTAETPPSVTPSSPTHTLHPPARMAVQNSAILTVTPQNATTEEAQNTPVTPAETHSDSASSQKERDINMLSTIDSHLDMMAFKHVALDGKLIDLVYSSDDTAILCKFFTDEHTWTVNVTQPIESCIWTDETGATLSPCLELLTQAAVLEKMENGATIVPTILLVRGTINNAKEVEQYLLKNQITLVKYNPSESDNIRDLHDLLTEKFDIFKEDEEEQKDTDQPS